MKVLPGGKKNGKDGRKKTGFGAGKKVQQTGKTGLAGRDWGCILGGRNNSKTKKRGKPTTASLGFAEKKARGGKKPGGRGGKSFIVVSQPPLEKGKQGEIGKGKWSCNMLTLSPKIKGGEPEEDNEQRLNRQIGLGRRKGQHGFAVGMWVERRRGFKAPHWVPKKRNLTGDTHHRKKNLGKALEGRSREAGEQTAGGEGPSGDGRTKRSS